MLAIIVFAIFFFVARTIKQVVRRLTRNRRHARNLGMVLGRLAQGTTILVGLFISLTIVIPTLRAGDLVKLLGISGGDRFCLSGYSAKLSGGYFDFADGTVSNR